MQYDHRNHYYSFAQGDYVMIIQSVDVFLLDCGLPRWRPVVCRVNTDEGISGFGEAAVAFDAGAQATYEMIKGISHYTIGADAMAHEAVWDKLYKSTFWAQGGGAVIFGAMSAIDTALWDIKGKALGVPLYKILGGKCFSDGGDLGAFTPDGLRCYASQLQFGWENGWGSAAMDEQLVHACVKAVSEGFDAIKINLITFDDHGKRMGFLRGPLRPEVRKMVHRRISKVREAIGDDVDIILENHGRTDAVSAIEIGSICEPYRILFMEEAATPLYPETMKIIRDRTSIPLAGGERLYSRWSFQNCFDLDAIQIAQPDIGTCGGITEAKKICDIAHTHDVGIQIHVCGSPISVAASLHLEASIPNFVIHECHVVNRSKATIELGVYDYAPVNGRIQIPELPGIGQELSEKAMQEAIASCTIKE